MGISLEEACRLPQVVGWRDSMQQRAAINLGLGGYCWGLAVLVPVLFVVERVAPQVLPQFVGTGLAILGIGGQLAASVAIVINRRADRQLGGAMLALLILPMLTLALLPGVAQWWFVALLAVGLWFAGRALLAAPVVAPTAGGYRQTKALRQAVNASKFSRRRRKLPPLPMTFYRSAAGAWSLVVVLPLAVVFFWAILDDATHGTGPHAIIWLIIGANTVAWCVSIPALAQRIRIAAPVLTLTAAALVYPGTHHQQHELPWSTVTALKLHHQTVETRYNSLEQNFLFVYVQDPDPYLGAAAHRSPALQWLLRMVVSQTAANFEAEFPGLALALPIDHLGVDPQALVDFVTRVWHHQTIGHD